MNIPHSVWIGMGWLGQFVFGSRFVVQWIYSEYKQDSVIPVVFWYLSILGTLLLLAYSIYRQDMVFIAGFSLNLLIYLRNLVLIHKKKKS